MKNIIVYFTCLFALFSCSKSADEPNQIKSAIDPNIYFTATFSGKTIRTNGYTISGGGISTNLDVAAAVLNTSNNNIGGVTSTLTIMVNASLWNPVFNMAPYSLPKQQCDVSIILERKGNAVGSYTNPFSYSAFTDLTVGKKIYEFDPTTVFTVTLADINYVQGTYTGKLIDGSVKIPVTGSFKLRKM